MQRFTAALGFLLLMGLAALAAPPDDDPFAPANAVKKEEPKEQTKLPAEKPKETPVGSAWVRAVGKTPPTASLINFDVSILPHDPFSKLNHVNPPAGGFRRGETVLLQIKGTPKKDYHTYPLTEKAPNQGSGLLSSLIYQDVPGLRPLWPIAETKSTFHDTGPTAFGVILEHDKPFAWTQEILILPDAVPGEAKLPFSIKLQVCHDELGCTPGTHSFEASIPISDKPALPLTEDLKKQMAVKPEVRVVPLPPEFAKKGNPTTPKAGTPGVTPKPDDAKRSLLGVILASMGAAIAMVFTPCVFPMIPITVSFFLKQSEKEHHRPLVTAAVYSITIIVVLTLAVLVLGQFIVILANSVWLNLGLGLLLIFFALSLFGMYEIELPSFLAHFTSSREGQGGYAGAFFMALTFTITSFTCTGPFLGPLLVSVKEMQLSFPELVLASFAYSATFAAPFFVLALFPTALKALPRSGGWLNSVKVVMGFLELAAALKFLGNTDLAINPGNPWFFNYETVLCSWIVLSVACGLYLLGLYRLPHDSPVESIGAIRLILATIFMGIGLYMLPALWRIQPQGIIGEGLVAFLPYDTKPRSSSGGNGGDAQAHLDWHLDYEKAWEQAVREKKPIFIDFTGVNCTNCRDNENRVFPKPEVRRELEKYVRVQMYNDTVPKAGLSLTQATEAADRNRELQTETFQDVTTPLYIIFQPSKDKPIEDGKLKGVELGRMKGKIFDHEIGQFLTLLQKPFDGQVAQAQSR